MLLTFFKLSFILSLTVWPFGSDKGQGPVIKKSAFDLPSDPNQVFFIKILIQSGADGNITIQTDTPYRVLDAEKRIIFQAAKMAPSRVLVKGDVTQIGSQPFHTNPVTIESETHGVKLRGAWYRHALEIWREPNGKLTIINDIPIEDYLKGVLPSEVNPKWPMESLRAQAIASRTYALFKMIENQNQKYHLSKDVLSQVYGGKNLEHALSNQAVEDTQGQILLYQNKIFPAYFHSTCGGRTTHAEYIWPVEPHGALKGVECNFCWQSSHYKWTADFSLTEIESKLKAKGVKVSGIQGIQLGEKDETGRAKYFVIHSASGAVNVHSNDFRLWISPAKLKSTWIQAVEKKSGKVYFRGRGWGHGVGICQYGIKQLGEMGYTADRILKYYYPGSQTVQYWAEPPRSLSRSVKGLVHSVKSKLDLE